MAKLLLTSSQVQVIGSGFVIILCTAALFFSGYVLQQRTLRELRVAINPRNSRPSPKVYVPERFRTTTTTAKKLQDGTRVGYDGEANMETRRQQLLIEVKKSVPGATDGEDNAVSKKNIDIVQGLKAKVLEKMENPNHVEAPVKGHKPVSKAQRRKMIKQELQKSAQSEEPAYYQRRLW